MLGCMYAYEVSKLRTVGFSQKNLSETKIWLEDWFPFEKTILSGVYVSFREGI